ncbi:hypothetical protein L1987_35195 [Smallanthus sonchifolius]|uniref:Uncharacterized protein n=1 Tax=Smallanthus sonchifolius TaxID=185202 RepID=A0ACB9HVX7_9ASTR|nr:hypothetical protein L1987_35195 [Smallanthus sonchifolius]
MLQQVTGSRASKSLLWSYKRSFNGFVAKLTEDEKNQLARMEGVVSVFPRENKQLHTTRSWDFIGFPQDVNRAPLESDVIVGMLDTDLFSFKWSFRCGYLGSLDAIAEGVDIISISVGGSIKDYCKDSIAIGAFHSMKNGILTSNSDGNRGPRSGTISNLSPWSLSVAASIIDRRFLTQIVLGNNKTYEPDLTAPGVHILAAWSQGTTVTRDVGDTRVVPFNVLSGTSMVCPHATGAAVYVKSFHPTWSPTMIKSALMTTATPMSPTKNPDAEFANGSGHIDPLKAVDPGACSEATNATVWDLNYPSFALSAKQPSSISRSFNRTVTNVGAADSSYQANVVAPSGLVVKVNPSNLAFKAVGEKQSFVVTVDATIGLNALSGSLVWSDGVHKVTSPIVAFLF